MGVFLVFLAWVSFELQVAAIRIEELVEANYVGLVAREGSIEDEVVDPRGLFI